MEKKKTIGEIAKSHGFDSPVDFFNHWEKLRSEVETFNVGDTIILPENYEPTHFEDEKCLPTNTNLTITEIGKVNMGGEYQLKVEGYDEWFWGHIFICIDYANKYRELHGE